MEKFLLIIVGLIVTLLVWQILAFGVGIDARGQLVKNEKIGHRITGAIILLIIFSCFCIGGWGGYKLLLSLLV